MLTRGNQGLQGLQGYGQQTPQQGWAGPRATSDYDPTAPTMDAFQYQQQQQQQQQQYAYQYNQAPPQQQQAPYSAPQVFPPPPAVARRSSTPSHPPLFSPSIRTQMFWTWHVNRRTQTRGSIVADAYA